jgi:hypothetical protein
MTRFYATLLAALLASCSTGAPDVASIGPKPANYAEIVKGGIKTVFFDPYSIRDAEISEPFPGGTAINYSFESGEGWVVCVRANAKNRLGAYVGLQETAFIIRNGSIVHRVEPPIASMHCSGAHYTPFTVT